MRGSDRERGDDRVELASVKLELDAERRNHKRDNEYLVAELAAAHEALRELANEAAHAVAEPRRFHENEGNRQQTLGAAVAAARLAVLGDINPVWPTKVCPRCNGAGED